jgi:hypothetical protein
VIIKDFLQLFHNLHDSRNILSESSELSAILDYSGYVNYVTSGVTQIFILTASGQYVLKTRFWLPFQILNSIEEV